MKKLLCFMLICCAGIQYAVAQCSAYFSTNFADQQVTFRNLSNVSNPHCYWNFGDGSSSLFYSPVHIYPASGTYMVSLFVKDTINNCTSYYDAWISVTKRESDPCRVAIDDSFFTWNGAEYMTLVDRSDGCHPLGFISMDLVNGGNIPIGNWASLQSAPSFRYASRGRYSVYAADSIVESRYAYKSFVYHYTSAKNYGPCSANFEFTTIREDSNGRLILFSAMNKNAAQYTWSIAGFGPGITGTSDTISCFYPYYGILFPVALTTVGQSGCRDTLCQHINTTKTTTYASAITYPLPITVYPNPVTYEATIEFPLTNEEEAAFTLYNSLGQTVKTMEHISIGRIILHRNNLAPGFYHYQLITSGNRIGTGKLVIR